MPRTIVVLSAVRPFDVPAAALPELRAAARVIADPTVPDDVVAALGVERDGDADVILTLDPTGTGDRVITAAPVTGEQLLRAVAVMDRLRSPGGCPWDAEQTHESLLQYLVEESYELYEAVEDGDRVAMREELGDVLLQVLFHARVAAEHETEPFDVDDAAADLVAKLVGRHPHVFAGTERVDTAERQEHRWEELKRAEKKRASSIDGVASTQPAVALAAKLVSRTSRAGLPEELIPAADGVGSRLFALAARAKLAGIDPEAELRTAARRFADDVRAAESAAREAGLDVHALDPDDWKRFWPERPVGPGPG